MIYAQGEGRLPSEKRKRAGRIAQANGVSFVYDRQGRWYFEGAAKARAAVVAAARQIGLCAEAST